MVNLLKQQPVSLSDIKKLAPSITVMVTANLVPLIGVPWFDWSVFALLVLFWIENVITGLFYVPRIVMAKGHENPAIQAMSDKITPALVWGMAAFFCVHYGMFTYGHGTFVFSMMGGDKVGGGHYAISDVFSVIGDYGLEWAVVALIVSHGFSFGYNYVYKEKYKEAIFFFQMFRPYNRVVMLHLTIIIGGALMMFLDEPLMGLVVLLVIKIFMDIKSHVNEHLGIGLSIMGGGGETLVEALRKQSRQ